MSHFSPTPMTQLQCDASQVPSNQNAGDKFCRIQLRPGRYYDQRDVYAKEYSKLDSQVFQLPREAKKQATWRPIITYAARFPSLSSQKVSINVRHSIWCSRVKSDAIEEWGPNSTSLARSRSIRFRGIGYHFRPSVFNKTSPVLEPFAIFP